MENDDFFINENLFFIYSQETNDMYKFSIKIKEHLVKLLRNTNNRNTRHIRICPLLLKVVYSIIKENNSYQSVSDEFFLEKLQNVNLNNIIEKILQFRNTGKLCMCNIFSLCYFNIPNNSSNNEIIYMIIEYYVLNYGFVPKCHNLYINYLFYIQEKKIATIDELNQFENLMNEIENDPDEFHEKYKHKLPTKNLSNLKPKTMNNDFFEKNEPVCSICQYEIEVNQNFYELPCSHLFHVKNDECLENATILFWLKDNKFCPLCKQEVIL